MPSRMLITLACLVLAPPLAPFAWIAASGDERPAYLRSFWVRASLVVIAATMSMFSIPEAGLLLILAVDHFLDMGRSATNVVGNAVASTVVAKWEGDLDPEEPVDIEPPHAPTHRPKPEPGTDHF